MNFALLNGEAAVVYATAADVAASLGRALTTDETNRAPALVADASDLVDGYLNLGEPVAAPIPGPITRTVSGMVARVFRRGESAPSGGEDNVTQRGRTMGPFSEQYTYTEGSTSGAPWLERSDKLKLAPYRCGMHSAALSGDHTGRYRRLV